MTREDSFSRIFRRTRFGAPWHQHRRSWLWLVVVAFLTLVAPEAAAHIASDVRGGVMANYNAQKASSSQQPHQTTQRDDGQRETLLAFVVTRRLQQQKLRQRQQYLQKGTTIQEKESTVAAAAASAFQHRNHFVQTQQENQRSTERHTEDQEALPTTSLEDATWHAEQEGGTEETTSMIAEEETQNNGLKEGTNSSSTTPTTMGLHMTLWPGASNGSTFPPENTESVTEPPDAEPASSDNNEIPLSGSTTTEVVNVSNETIATQGTAPANEAGNLTATETTTLESTQTASPSNEQSLLGSIYMEKTLPPTPGASTSSSTSNPDAATSPPSMSGYQYPKPPQPAPTYPPKPTTAPPSSAPLVYEAPDDDVLKQNAQDDQVVEEAWTQKSPMQHAQETASAMMNDRNVKIAVSIASVVAVVLLLCTAQQLLERPEGLCARICKLTLAASHIMCLPCRMLLCCPWCNRNGSRRGGHILVANDASGNDGFGFSHDLELS